jgi:lipoprotein-anchoring transpeptidase ErfK/SrfK
MSDTDSRFTRRQFGQALGAASLAAPLLSPAILRAQATPGSETEAPQYVSNAFVTKRWQDYFDNRHNGVILVDTAGRVLHFWSEDGETYLVFPTSVPISETLTRRGRTRVVRKVVGPEWRPTPSMLAREPDLPKYIGPGPENPLGTHAMYLSWRYYRIHGTNDNRKIGRQASNGCIGLFNEDIVVLFEKAKVGTQVLLI